MNVLVWFNQVKNMKKISLTIIIVMMPLFSACYNELHNDIDDIFKANCYGTLIAAQNQSEENPDALDYALAFCAYTLK
jgi:hypothetical protein